MLSSTSRAGPPPMSTPFDPYRSRSCSAAWWPSSSPRGRLGASRLLGLPSRSSLSGSPRSSRPAHTPTTLCTRSNAESGWHRRRKPIHPASRVAPFGSGTPCRLAEASSFAASQHRATRCVRSSSFRKNAGGVRLEARRGFSCRTFLRPTKPRGSTPGARRSRRSSCSATAPGGSGPRRTDGSSVTTSASRRGLRTRTPRDRLGRRPHVSARTIDHGR